MCIRDSHICGILGIAVLGQRVGICLGGEVIMLAVCQSAVGKGVTLSVDQGFDSAALGISVMGSDAVGRCV